MPLSRKVAIGALVLSLAPAFLGAYEEHLSSAAIREAYFLRRDNNNRTAEFLAQYVHRLPVPKTGPRTSPRSKSSHQMRRLCGRGAKR